MSRILTAKKNHKIELAKELTKELREIPTKTQTRNKNILRKICS